MVKRQLASEISILGSYGLVEVMMICWKCTSFSFIMNNVVFSKDDLMKGMSNGFVLMNHPLVTTKMFVTTKPLLVATKLGGSQGQSYGFAVTNLNSSQRMMI